MENEMARLLTDQYSEVLATYLEQGALGVAVFDSDRRLRSCNLPFARATGLDEPHGNPQLDELVHGPGDEDLTLPPEGGNWNVNLVFRNVEGQSRQLLCSIYHVPGDYVIFCHPSEAADALIVERISRLNDELTDLNRELRKKEQALERANERIRRIARTDPLTGLPNRRHFNERLSDTMSAVKRHAFPLSITMADLDHFKDVNDTYGHDTGDKVLKLFANLLQESCRREDIAARWGGEEFIVMMPYTPPENAKTFAERVRRSFKEAECEGVDQSFSASFGVSGYSEEDTQDSLLNRADQALYKAKDNGRDRVEVL